MDHYLDLRLRPDPEFSPAHLMNAAFAKLHRAFVRLRNRDIGVSFPEAAAERPWLGNCLRLHGSALALHHLMGQDWLVGMRDHVDISDIAMAPASAGHQIVRRTQVKSSAERIRRRQMKRKGWSADEARAAIPDGVAEALSLPYLTIRSQSTGQAFRLFISQRPVEHPAPGDFNCYGISSVATVPRF